MTQVAIRVAPENPLFRLPEVEDLVPGAEFFMIDRAYRFEFVRPFRRIKLDDTPVAKRPKGPHVLYRCTYPEWHRVCEVPLDEFLGKLITPFSNYYWLPNGG